MPAPAWTQWLRAYWLRLLLTAVLLAVFFGNQGFRGLVANWLELRRLRGEIAALEADNVEVGARLKELRENESALEREARRIGFKKGDEIEYRFEPPKR